MYTTTKRHDWTTARYKMCPVLSVITFAVMCISVGKQMLLFYAAHLEHSTDYESMKVKKESFIYSPCKVLSLYSIT